MSAITAQLDAYGTYARTSALADILEVQALSGPSASPAELADHIRDRSWTGMLEEPFHVPDDESGIGIGEELDAATEYAHAVFDLLEERTRILEDRYPFEISDSRLHYRGQRRLEHPYLVLLAVTITHAYKLVVGENGDGVNPRYYFEELVQSALSERGLLTANIGKIARRAARFPDALAMAGAACRLAPTPNRAVYRNNAQEEGADILAHLDWSDSRPVHWVFVVQATCARSDSWSRKLYDASPSMWEKLLGLHVMPKVALAVPHHIPERALRYVLQHDNNRLILDRLRLSVPSLPMDNDAFKLLDALKQIKVEWRDAI